MFTCKISVGRVSRRIERRPCRHRGNNEKAGMVQLESALHAWEPSKNIASGLTEAELIIAGSRVDFSGWLGIYLPDPSASSWAKHSQYICICGDFIRRLHVLQVSAWYFCAPDQQRQCSCTNDDWPTSWLWGPKPKGLGPSPACGLHAVRSWLPGELKDLGDILTTTHHYHLYRAIFSIKVLYFEIYSSRLGKWEISWFEFLFNVGMIM